MPQEKPTSIDIAYRAGVSQSTVSRALRNSPLVSEATREKVQAIAKELNYQVDKQASNLRSQSTRTLALLLCEDPTSDESNINPFFLSMLGSITRAAARRDYDLLVSFQQLSEDWHAQYEEAHRADGIILLGYGDYLSAKPKFERLRDSGARFILWGPELDELKGHSTGCDNHLGGYLAAEHLIKQGRTNIAFFGDTSRNCPEFRDRYLGHADALAESKIALNPYLQEDAENLKDSGYQACQRLLQSGRPFDAILAASDLIAIGAINALQEAGFSVPEKVAVMGFDDITSSAYVTPPLTTVLQDTGLAGEMLVENLLAQINGETPNSVLLTPQLIVRESCGATLSAPTASKDEHC